MRQSPSLAIEHRAIGAARSHRRWALIVVASGALSGALAGAGLAGVLAVAVGLAAAAAGIGDLVASLIVDRFEEVGQNVARHQATVEDRLFDQLVDGSTHGWFAQAAETLDGAQTRLERHGSAGSEHAQAVAGARTLVAEIELRLARSEVDRRPWHGRGLPAGASWSFARPEPGEEPASFVRLYSDPSNAPDWLGPRSRDAVVRAGAVLDNVRLLHTAQIEWAVLLFTLWARALLVGGAPLLASVSLGRVPLQDGWSARDLPWALATSWSAATALRAPWIASAVMRRDEQGATVRRRLLIVEVPLCVAAIVASPCWAVAVFAAGWTNWWQRPDFDWARLAWWIVLVGGLLTTGAALAGAGPAQCFVEFAITMTVVAVIGGSYGAMLPVSASLMARALTAGLLTPRRAQARADERLGDSVRQLLQAARAIELSSPDDPSAIWDSRRLADVARALGARADEGDRWSRRTPLGLPALLLGALSGAGPIAGSPEAASVLHDALRAGEPEPVTIETPSLHQSRLKHARLRRRKAARALSLAIVETVREARRHGTGPLTTLCRLEDDRVVLRFANLVRPGPARPGRGTGASRLWSLVGSLPDGRIDTRELVASSFVDYPSGPDRFGVQISFSSDALDDLADSQP